MRLLEFVLHRAHCSGLLAHLSLLCSCSSMFHVRSFSHLLTWYHNCIGSPRVPSTPCRGCGSLSFLFDGLADERAYRGYGDPSCRCLSVHVHCREW
jgi:hypothetical protein